MAEKYPIEQFSIQNELKQIDEVKKVLNQNISTLYLRTENLEKLQARADLTSRSASVLAVASNIMLKKKMCPIKCFE